MRLMIPPKSFWKDSRQRNLWRIIANVSVLSLMLAVVAPLTAQTSTPSANGGWPVFRGDSHSTGVARTKLPNDLEVLWEYRIPNGAFEGTPLIVEEPDGKKTVYAADLDGSVTALDLASGEKKWATKLSISISASPAYRDGRIYVGDIDGFFYCLNNEGEVLWKVETGNEINSGANFYGDKIVFGSQDCHLYVLDAKTGKMLLKHETPDQIQCSATVVGDRAFVAGCDGYFHVVDLKTGKEVGNVDIHSPTQSTPAVHGDLVYFGTEQAEFFSVNWKEIKADWNFQDKRGQSSVRGSAAVNEDHIIFGARNRQVYSLDPVTGKVNWSVTLKSKVESSPVIVDDKAFVGSTDGRFYSLALKDGKQVWEKQFKGGFTSSPAAAFERLVIATDRGYVYCLGSKKHKK